MTSELNFVSTIVNACCILHNLCEVTEVHGDGFVEEWLLDKKILSGPCSSLSTPPPPTTSCNELRNALCDYFDL